jgi:transposase
VPARGVRQWSNGPVEGHINRLKTLGRQMDAGTESEPRE